MTLSARILPDLDAMDTSAWDALGRRTAVDTSVFLTPRWQRSWWASFGRGELLPVVISRAGSPVLFAPMFVDGDMAFFVGAGGSDYLDFVGDSADVEAVALVLESARKARPDLLGMVFHHVLDDSPTGPSLETAAGWAGMDIFDEGHLAAPYLDIAGAPDAAEAAVRKKSLVRHDRWFRRNGELRIEHHDDGADITAHLDEVFDQHVSRWRSVGIESQFVDPEQRDFFRRIALAAGAVGWARLTRVLWNDGLIAAHFGFSHHGRFLWYKPSFDIALARRSPGEVLLRALLLEALSTGVRIFDFGLGDEPFKGRFATGTRTVRNWGLYPRRRS